MGFQTIGRVLDKWSAVPVLAHEGWGLPTPIGADEVVRYFLRVTLLHPETELASQRTVECVSAAQWERYPIGSWVRLRVRGWAPLYEVVRLITIIE